MFSVIIIGPGLYAPKQTLSTLLSLSAVVSAVVSQDTHINPKLSDRVKGQNPIKIIKLKDVDPKAPNGDTVVAKIWNSTSPAAPSEKRDLVKRQNVYCFNNPFYIDQGILYNAKNAMCNYLDSVGGVGYSASATIEVQWYQSGANWYPVVDTNGVARATVWDIMAPEYVGWAWDMCFQMWSELIWNCGNRPGYIDDYWGTGGYGWEGQLWFE
ncbi:hypothetical protein TWF694_003817 [Orbilia ellipsospora]|uniref:Uncharacterized protein n=1 Tax=Orbilia ellipsospora TaxID=2528407 RepID=A0AAV9WZN4_9PEZI